MRKPKFQRTFFDEFVNQPVLNKQQTDHTEIDLLLQRFNMPKTLLQVSMPIFYILDFANRSYLLFTENTKTVLGWHAKEFIEGGLDKTVDVYHSEDYRIMGDVCFPANMEVLNNTPVEKRAQLIFGGTCRLKNKWGKWVWVYDQCNYILCPKTGVPLYCAGSATDLSLVKKDSVIHHNVYLQEENKERQMLIRNFYYPNPEDALFTRRELEVLKWLADGHSSKVIASKLFISEHTVINHRKNMMKKSNSKNMAEIIKLAVGQGLI